MITIIPAIDIIEEKCVRLTRGDFSAKTIYDADPLAMARQFEDSGFRRLHLVDLDGARHKRIINYNILEKIATGTNLVIDFGGGLQSNEDLYIAFESGAAQITAGSIAVKQPDLVVQWLSSYGAEKIILGSDVKDGHIAISGWQEKTDLRLTDFLTDYITAGIKTIICTDIDRDGVLAGPAFDLYESIINDFPTLELIASGGISHIDDLEKLDEMKIDGAIIGKALYEGKIQLKELKSFLC